MSCFQDGIEFLLLSWSIGALLATHRSLSHSTSSWPLSDLPAAQILLATQRIAAYSPPDHSVPFSLPDNLLANLGSQRRALLAARPAVRLEECKWTVVGSLTGSQAVAYRSYEHSEYALAR